MDIANANKFTYGKVTVKEMTDALKKAFAKLPPRPIIYGNDEFHKRMNASLLQGWEVTQKELSTCPNCKEIAEDGHCSYCDYPYNI